MAANDKQQNRTVVTMGTATPGGGFPLYGGVVAEAIAETDPTIAIECRNTKGSTENVPLLEAGELDIALVQGEVAYESLSGIGRPPADLRILAAMYSTPGMFVVRGDSPCRTISDLRGQPVAFGAKGSGLVILNRYVLDGLGLEQGRNFQAVYLDKAGDGPAMVLDGRVAALWGGGAGWPGFTAVCNGPSGARFITPTRDEAKTILGKHSFLKALTLPAGSYPGQNEAVDSVGSWSLILARPSLDDEIAYRLAKTLHKAEGALVKRLDQARETTPQNTASAAPDLKLVHRGVLRYLKEIGAV